MLQLISPPQHLSRTFKTAWFAKAAKKRGISDEQLCIAMEQIRQGQAVNLGGGVWKKLDLWRYAMSIGFKKTSKSGAAKVRSIRARSDAFEAIHSAAADLFEVGAIDKKTMREFDASCLVPPDLGARDVKRIRSKLRVSQEVLARAIGATKSTVAKWESGVNTPSPMAQRLLRVIDKHSLDILG